MSGDRSPSDRSESLDTYGNPFSTRYVSPGAVTYRFPRGDNLGRLLRRWEDADRWGQIIGPHGSGKSTLVEDLRRPLIASGASVTLFTMHDGQRRLPPDWQTRVRESASSPEVSGPTVVVVDGYEQLGRLARGALKRSCRRRRWGLLVTAHRSVGLPPLMQTTATVEQLARVVRLLVCRTTYHVSDALLAELMVEHEGNVRSVLFDLYDRYEASDRRHC